MAIMSVLERSSRSVFWTQYAVWWVVSMMAVDPKNPAAAFSAAVSRVKCVKSL
jgi:hypothetical protein